MSPPWQLRYRLQYRKSVQMPLRGRRGDACERRLWRKKRARRSGRIKAIGKRASPTQTEPLIQQNMSPPYIGAYSAGSVSSALSVRWMAITRLPSSMRMMITPCVSLP